MGISRFFFFFLAKMLLKLENFLSFVFLVLAERLFTIVMAVLVLDINAENAPKHRFQFYLTTMELTCSLVVIQRRF